MRKMLAIITIVTILLMCLTACSNNMNTSKNNQHENNASDEENSNMVQVDENLLTVDVTLGASEDNTEEKAKEVAERAGYIAYKINDDGSVTYTMTKAKRDEMLQEFKSQADDAINELLNGNDKVESFTKIEYNDNLSEVNIYVDADRYSIWDYMNIYIFFFIGSNYQNFAGIDSNEIDVIVNLIDKDTEEIIDSGSYRSYMEDS